MLKAAVYSDTGEQVDEMELSDKIFGEKINEAVVHQVAVNQMANARRGTASTKSRSEVRGGGRKPWRQKGTGRARAGSNRSPLWKGGGIIFGPKPRGYRYNVPKKIKRLALRSVLSSKFAKDDLIVIDELSLDEPKTKRMLEILKTLNVEKNALVVAGQKDENVNKSIRNIPDINYKTADGLNVLDLLNHQKIVMTKDAVAYLQEVLNSGKS